ncbi:hypothetical protein I7I50_03825 [Histoplasma capsulatum G186AR]|uniref:Uncharacterized protein n=1 Tax=Ajellomyces capsulatus TaxID=5037 RepID=A0A8H7YPT3_AJECA|nr:hypothetical protein I7I52_04733 [Histoplasma capsulatum]QSS74879.1 hypothetical protein I7I50_03825 [Histoplasma capsulatum G186AR]
MFHSLGCCGGVFGRSFTPPPCPVRIGVLVPLWVIVCYCRFFACFETNFPLLFCSSTWSRHFHHTNLFNIVCSLAFSWPFSFLFGYQHTYKHT